MEREGLDSLHPAFSAVRDSDMSRLARRGAIDHVLRGGQLDFAQAIEKGLRASFRFGGNLVFYPPELSQNLIFHQMFLPSTLLVCIFLDKRTRELHTPSGSGVSPRHCLCGDNSKSRDNPYCALPRWPHALHRLARRSAERGQKSTYQRVPRQTESLREQQSPRALQVAMLLHQGRRERPHPEPVAKCAGRTDGDDGPTIRESPVGAPPPIKLETAARSDS
jgi:hypothetical protein